MTEDTLNNGTIITDILNNDISIALDKLFILLEEGSSNDVPNKESDNLSSDTMDIFNPTIISVIETIRG